jgi:hypothetical protein
MNVKLLLSIIVLAALLSSCRSAQVSMVGGNPPNHPVNSIVISTSGGILADAIGIQLVNRGYEVIEPNQASNLVARYNLSETEISTPQNLKILMDNNIDAYLIVRVSEATDGYPQSASVRLVSTHTGRLISGTSWQNGYGGVQGSLADRMMRVDINKAANSIVNALCINLGKKNNRSKWDWDTF